MVHHPGPDRKFSLWCKEKKSEWIGVDCGSADHPMLALVPQAQVNTIIRNWMPRQAAEADKLFRGVRRPARTGPHARLGENAHETLRTGAASTSRGVRGAADSLP